METGSFTESEWLAILPNSGPPAATGKDSDAFRSVARFSRLLAALQRLQVMCMSVPWTTFAMATFSTNVLGTLLAVVTAVIFSSQSTATVGVVAYALYSVPMSFITTEYIVRYRRRPIREPPRGANLLKYWAALFSDGGKTTNVGVTDGVEAMSVTRAGRLIAHEATDELCPCPLPSCSGTLPQQAAVRYLISSTFIFSIMVGSHFLALWTSLVTFSRSMWATWLVSHLVCD